MPYPCWLCDADLLETETEAVCSFCGQVQPVDYICPNGHVLCEDCQLAEPVEIIARVCEGTEERDPGLIANLIMKHPGFALHGPHHHGLIAPAVLAALTNRGQYPRRSGRAAAARDRTVDIPLAACGSRGECGAAVSVGALVSILTKATYLKDRERSLALQATAEALMTIAKAGGPRCCKQSTYISLEIASAFLERELGIAMPLTLRCAFSDQDEACKHEACPYYEA